MDKKICIVTGGNAGIGYESVKQLLEKECYVIMACRNEERGNDAYNNIKKEFPDSSLELCVVDMGEQSSIKQFSKYLHEKFNRVDVIIHNAAIFNITQKKPILTAENIESVWAINHLGPVLLNNQIIDLLKNSDNGRIITISSQGLIAKPFLKIDFEDPEFKNKKYNIVNAYYQSKLAQVMYTYWLAKELMDTNITVNSIRVTAVKIDINRHPELSNFMKWVYKQKAKKSISAFEMAKTYTYAALSNELAKKSGVYINEKNKFVKSNTYTNNPENINKLINLTRKYIKEI